MIRRTKNAKTTLNIHTYAKMAPVPGRESRGSRPGIGLFPGKCVAGLSRGDSRTSPSALRDGLSMFFRISHSGAELQGRKAIIVVLEIHGLGPPAQLDARRCP